MPVRQLTEFLDSSNVSYTTNNHLPTYTAQDLAQTMHISGHNVAKTIIVNIDNKLVMVVLPACEEINLSALQDALNAKHVEIAKESAFEDCFPLCDTGSMPPFGNLYGMDVIVSSTLAHDEVITFNAGNYTEVVNMSFADYKKIVSPTVLNLTITH